MTDRYVVIGNPIAHSKSPIIHAAFAAQTGQDMRYEAILAPLDGFEATVRDLMAKGYKGANITVPFKLEAYKICDTRSSQAQLASAVNTMIFDDIGNNIFGHNTDGDGLFNDITVNLKTEIEGARILLLGAGGAALGVYENLLVEKPASLVVANRTLSKAEALVSRSKDKAWTGIAKSFEGVADEQFDIVINATSTGLSDMALPISDSIFAKKCLAYDMVYGRETPFMAQARAAGARVSDGLGMLVEQAAKSFYLWREVKPETAPVIEMLRKTN